MNNKYVRNPIPSQAKCVFKGVIFDVYQWQQEMFDGSVETFERLKRPDTVNVIPVTSDKKIIVLEQKQPTKDWFWSIPGGRVNQGEGIEEAAERELEEESGYKTEQLVLFDSVAPMPKVDWSIHTFVGKNCQPIGAVHLDAGEKIKVHLVSFDEFIEICLQDDFYEYELKMKILKAKLDKNEFTKLQKTILD